MRRRLRAQPRFWRLMIFATLVCFGASCAVAQLHYARSSARAEKLSQERSALSETVSELTARLDYVRTDEYVERVARDELNMLRPGEIRYVSNR